MVPIIRLLCHGLSIRAIIQGASKYQAIRISCLSSQLSITALLKRVHRGGIGALKKVQIDRFSALLFYPYPVIQLSKEMLRLDQNRLVSELVGGWLRAEMSSASNNHCGFARSRSRNWLLYLVVMRRLHRSSIHKGAWASFQHHANKQSQNPLREQGSLCSLGALRPTQQLL